MASINLVYRTSTKEGYHPGSLALRLIHDRQVKTITLKGCRLYPDEWDKASQTVVFPKDNPGRVTYLEKVETRINNETNLIYGFILALEDKGRYTLDDLLKIYYRKNRKYTLLGYVKSLVKVMENRGQKRTARAYLTVTRGLIRFSGDENMSLDKNNSRLIKDFETHLREKERLPNTISYYTRNLRAIFNKAVADKLIVSRKNEHPFAMVFTGVVKTMKRTLSLDETRKLLDLDLDGLAKKKGMGSSQQAYLKRLSTSLRYFSFCLHARGMCFVDMVYLKKTNIESGFIRYTRKKTGQQIEVRITPWMQTIIDSFKEETVGSPYVFPVIRDTRKSAFLQYESATRAQNNRLKKLAALAGIHKKISTHWARHTWANVGKSIHLPTTVIGEGLGHTSENTTLIYLAGLNNSVLDEANDLIALAINSHRINAPSMTRV